MKNKRWGSEDDWKLVIRYRMRNGGPWNLKDIMHSELEHFIVENALGDLDCEIVEIHKPGGEVIR